MINQEEEKRKQAVVLPTWVMSLTMLITVVVIIAIILLQFTRYRLVGQSIQKGDLTSSTLLLSPEISTGISAIIRSL